MSRREDYEHLEREVNGTHFWWINNDVKYIGRHCTIAKLGEVARYFYEEESKITDSLYHKGTRLYFTYFNQKYHLSWVFYNKDLIYKTCLKLQAIGCTNIQINYGELD